MRLHLCRNVFPLWKRYAKPPTRLSLQPLLLATLSTAPSIDSGFTVQCVGLGVGGSSWAGAAGYKVLTAASAQNPTWTTAASSIGATSTAVFKY